ncbi:MAG: sugar phosphate isomerase/epimerase family protein [Armatimonadota bacterium]
MATLSIGVITYLGPEPGDSYKSIRDLGLTTCQLSNWNPLEVTPAQAELHRQAAAEAGIAISLFWCGYTGPVVWDYIDGPATIGLVPPDTRETRVEQLQRGAEIAGWLGVEDMATHVGFLPVNPKDPDYLGAVDGLKRVAEFAGERGVYFNFETGQETPMVLLRTIQDIGLPNLGINLDPANLLMYGNGNPVDALNVFGAYVRGVHAKDGEYPTDGRHLGHEKPLGEGRVNFPVLVPKLKSLGYAGTLTIEREISGSQQIADIKRAIEILTPLL